MPRQALDSDITLASRYECKYLISSSRVSEIREFVAPFMHPDRYAAPRPEFRYPICSLYLDSPDLSLYQETVGGEKNRFKLRVRSYGDDAASPVYFEVKRKVDNIVQKRRARVHRAAARSYLDRRLDTAPSDPSFARDTALEYFHGHVELTAARPVMRVRYLREAYESRDGEPVRITIDTHLMHAATLGPELSHDRGRWVSTPVGGAILEIKFTELYPSWVRDLVRVFELNQQAVPKYVMSVNHMLFESRESVLGIAGLVLPVRRS
jgi:hypothetical protein